MPPSPSFSSSVYWPSRRASRTFWRRPKMSDEARVDVPAAAEEPASEKHQGHAEGQGALGPERPGAGVGPRNEHGQAQVHDAEGAEREDEADLAEEGQALLDEGPPLLGRPRC
jgi:hypothetical protein